jgi:hypothetical protein
MSQSTSVPLRDSFSHLHRSYTGSAYETHRATFKSHSTLFRSGRTRMRSKIYLSQNANLIKSWMPLKKSTKQKEASQSIAKTPWGPLWLKLKSGYKLFSRTAFLYSEHLDAMLLLAPSYVKLAWGGIHLLLAVQVSDEKLKECVEDHLLKISKNFDLIETLTAYIPSAKMVRALAEAYACYL